MPRRWCIVKPVCRFAPSPSLGPGDSGCVPELPADDGGVSRGRPGLPALRPERRRPGNTFGGGQPRSLTGGGAALTPHAASGGGTTRRFRIFFWVYRKGPDMNTIPLAQLDTRNGYLIDMSSALDLFGEYTDYFLCGRNQWNVVLDLWRQEKGRLRGQAWEKVAEATPPHVQQAIDILVTADQLAIDGVLLEGDHHFSSLHSSWASTHGVLVAADVPSKTKHRVQKELEEFRRDICQIQVQPYPYLCDDWAPRTNENILRALYYSRLSEVAGVHCFLSKAKRDYMEYLLEVGKKTATVSVTQIPNPHGEVMKAVLSELRNPDNLLPPIAEIVLVHALDSGKSPGDALLDVRNSAEAREYRQKLKDLRVGARAPTVGGRAEVEAFFRELRELGGIWIRDPYERVVYNTTRVHKALSAIPTVGPLLAHFLPRRAQEIAGRLVTRPNSVHLFISRWFRKEGQATNI